MTRVQTYPTPIDTTDPTVVHTISLTVEPVTTDMRHDPLARIQPLARFALLATDQFGHRHVLGTDADGLGNLVHLGRSVACAEHATFTEPTSTCLYCGSPTARLVDYCSDRPCEHLDGIREAGWWRDFPRVIGLAAPAAGLVA